MTAGAFDPAAIAVAPAPARRPPILRRPLMARFFGSPLNLMLTILLALLAIMVVPTVVRWAVIDAAWLPASPESCRDRGGACWSFVIAKHGQILFGIYPLDERWRPALSCVGLVALLGYSVRRSAWRPSLAIAWAGMLATVFVLMGGGVAGLTPVPSASWGGLPVTLILTVVAIGLGFPMGVLLALGRRSTLPAIRTLTIMFIESMRALPLLSILFIASIMLPLLLPAALLPDKFFRALIALLLFASAYLAEVVRGGIQAIPSGQVEAAKALGLSYWQVQRRVVLPQAIAIVIPALTNTIIIMIKNTSLVLVIGLFDLISSGKAALADPMWNSPAIETYVFVSLIYFVLCFSFSQFSERLERHQESKDRR